MKSNRPIGFLRLEAVRWWYLAPSVSTLFKEARAANGNMLSLRRAVERVEKGLPR